MLRLARPTDALALAQMSRALIETGLSWRYTPRRLEALIGAPDTVVLVASEGAAVHGFAAMEFGDERAHLVLLCVQAQQQRRGLGRSLHDWLLKTARVAGIASIVLELRIDNIGASTFYRSLGYEDGETVSGYYDGKIAARRMALTLRQGAATGEPPP
jgi:ribosomal protein S18 acetylase RimI-like enzyme